jgi:hypothetical protein
MFEFRRDATQLPGGEVAPYSDGAPSGEHVRPDLVAATPLLSGDICPDRHALLEPGAVLDQIAILRDEGNAARFGTDAHVPVGPPPASPRAPSASSSPIPATPDAKSGTGSAKTKC